MNMEIKNFKGFLNKKMKKNIIVLILIIISNNLKAQHKDTVLLNNVSISASRFNEESLNSNVLTTDSIENYFQETPVFFQRISSVVSQSDNGTPFGYSYFTLRGMSQTRINYTLNGVPLNDGEDLAVYTTNYTNILNNLGSVQIVRGTGVSSNGASSYVGLINMDLKNPFDNRKFEFSALGGSFSSFSQQISYNTGVLNNKFGAYISLSNTGTQGYRDYSWGLSQSGVISLGYKDSKNILRLNVIYGHTNNAMSWLPVPEGSNPKENVLVFGNLSTQEDEFDQGIYQLQYSRLIYNNIMFSISPYIVTLKGGYDYPLDEDNLGKLNLEALNRGGYTNIKLNKGNFKNEFGLNYNYFTRDHIGEIYGWNYKNIGTKIDGSIYFKSIYVVKKITLIGDIQIRKANFSYNSEELNEEFFDYTFFNYGLGINYKLNQKNNLYISFAENEREPTRTDLFGYNDHIDLTNVDQINNVKPEKVKDIEFGLQHSKENFKFNFNLYYMKFENEILSTNQLNYLGILLRKNVPESQRTGLEIELEYTINKLKFGGNINYSQNKVKINSENKTPILTPDLISYVYSILTIKELSVEINYKYAAQSFLESSNNKNFVVPEYHLLNGRISYKLKRNFEASMFINNILNQNWEMSGNCNFDDLGNPISRNYFYSSKANFFVQLTFRY